MLAAIDFDDQMVFEAGEVSDVLPDRHLPLELQTRHSAVAKLVPELPLGIGEVAAEPTRIPDTVEPPHPNPLPSGERGQVGALPVRLSGHATASFGAAARGRMPMRWQIA
jgi:hypothetical protein